MGRLLLVSNRLPITVRNDRGPLQVTRSTGGLATGLRGVHATPDTLWVGWPGDTARMSDGQRAELTRLLDTARLHAVPLSPSEVSAYYDGFSNGVLWPLFHYLLDRVPLEATTYDTWRRVNERFADIVADLVTGDDIAWVHDYHLCLVPSMLRARRPDLRIGFFLHIPFPAAELYRTLAWRRPVLEGLLGADVVGFHTAACRRHFADAAALILGHRIERAPRAEHAQTLRVGARAVRLVVAPMGVDVTALEHLARSPTVSAAAADLREPGTRLLLGVDRLDYTKGIPRRLLAFERLLERSPALRGHVRMLQVAVPSRERVDAYRHIRRSVEEHVGRINGLYTQGSTVPVHYVYRSLTEEQVVAHYRAADVMLVTPLRDGMNLVAKEFVAARDDLDGVLVLSELAGAAAELDAALLVNPYDVAAQADAVARALTMPEAERRLRMHTLRTRVRHNDVRAWANGFLAHLRAAPARPSPEPTRLDLAVATVRAAPRRLLLLDYDGTLVPFAPTPPQAAPDAELLELLRALARVPGTDLHIVSGRRRTDLQRWFGELPIGLHAEHGLWSRWPHRSRWEMRPLPLADWKAAVRPGLESWCARIPGALLEEKTASLAFHYRESGLLALPEALRAELEEHTRWLPVDLIAGSRVLELRARGTDKGVIVQALRARGALGEAILAMGDDRTDADLLGALPPEAVTVQVGDVPLPARWRVSDPKEARALLGTLLVGAAVPA